MKTYTIAYAPEAGLVLATVPDGGDIHSAVEAELDFAGIDEAPEYRVVTGVTLTDELVDGDVVIFSTSPHTGALIDENAVSYAYAVMARR